MNAKTVRASSALAVSATLLALCGLVLSPAWAVEEDGTPSNVYMTGAEVRIERAVEGDLTVAAGRIHVDQAVGGDGAVGVEEQHREHRPLLGPPEGDGQAGVERLEHAQNPELHGTPPAPPPGARGHAGFRLAAGIGG